MFPVIIFLLIAVPASLAIQIKDCNKYDNPGVYDEFGPLPSKLYDFRYYFEVVTSGRAFTTFSLKGTMDRYMMEYIEFKQQPGAGTQVYAYQKLLFKDGTQYRTLDYVRVNPKKWNEVENAIIDADHYATPLNQLRVKYMLNTCICTMRVYDLTDNDIVARANTEDCDGTMILNNPHRVTDPNIKNIFLDKLKLMGPTDTLPSCEVFKNNGVFNEFGNFPAELYDNDYYRRVHSTGYSFNTFSFDGSLYRYKVEYSEYVEQMGIGYDVFGYHTLYYNNEGKYMILDFLRVNPMKWKQVQFAVLNATEVAGPDNKLRIRYLTQDCLCVLRVYDLSYKNIPELSTTYACDETPMPTVQHKVAISKATKLIGNTNAEMIGKSQKYAGCDPEHNNGVLDMFGHLPTDLNNIDYYYEVINTGIAFTKFKLFGKLENYIVEYNEFREQPTIGHGAYAYLSLYYDDKSSYKLLDYIRVDPLRWKQIQAVILQADYSPDTDRNLRVRFLTTDCLCVMRIYDLGAMDIVGSGLSKSCDGLHNLIINNRKTFTKDIQSLQDFRKFTLNKWSHHYEPIEAITT